MHLYLAVVIEIVGIDNVLDILVARDKDRFLMHGVSSPLIQSKIGFGIALQFRLNIRDAAQRIIAEFSAMCRGLHDSFSQAQDHLAVRREPTVGTDLAHGGDIVTV